MSGVAFNLDALDTVLQGAGTYVGSPMLDLALIDPDPENPRSAEAFELDADWASFVDSIRMNGILEPLYLTPPNPSGRHMIIRGHRRYRGATAAGLPSAPVRYAGNASERERPLALYLDNVHRSDLHPIDEAPYLWAQMRRHNWDQAELARRASVSEAYVSQRLALLKLPDELRSVLRARGRFSVTAAANLARHFDRDAQQVQDFIASGKELSMEAVDRLVAGSKPAKGGGGTKALPSPAEKAAVELVTEFIDGLVAGGGHGDKVAQALTRIKTNLSALK